MQIIIEIAEDIKEDIDKHSLDMACSIVENRSLSIAEAIRNGITLPKGHGRLGDFDALEKEMVNGILAGNYEEGYETFAHINNMDDCVECVKYADTVVEADKKSEDKE